MTKLYSHETGPLIEWDGQFVRIEDLNPHVQTKWRMSRGEVFRFGVKVVWTAITRAS